VGFIREYAAAGDPFSLRRPKWARRFKPGKSLGKLAGVAAGLIPGVGPVISQLLPHESPVAAAPTPTSGVMQALLNYGFDPDQAIAFARSYGLDVGDPAAPRRKGASAGPKSKAKAKATARTAKATGTKTPKPKAKQAKGKGGKGKIGGLIDAIATHGPELGGLISQIPGVGGLTKYNDPAVIARQMGFGGGRGGHRRSMNPTNVKALRRSIRRLEGFSRVIKSVRKAARGLKGDVIGGQHHHAAAHPARGRRGHKAGCGCFACKRRAA